MSYNAMPWSVIQALVSAGHLLPKDINQFALKHDIIEASLSVVRWLLQQGMRFDSEILSEAARAGRVDILQLAHTMCVPITADMINTGTWEVVIWACRNGVPVNSTILQQLVRTTDLFDFPEQKAELLSLLRSVRKHQPPVPADSDGAGDGSRAHKRRKSKR